MCLHFSYPDSIHTRAQRFLRCIPSQVCFEPLTRTRKRTAHWHLARNTVTAQRQEAPGPSPGHTKFFNIVEVSVVSSWPPEYGAENSVMTATQKSPTQTAGAASAGPASALARAST
jgi:hypothetical protein